MKIKNGIEALELSMNVMGNVSTIYPTLLWDENEAVLVDTGTPGQLPAIREAFEKAGVPFNKLSKVILTHQDFDHIGSLPELLKEFDGPIEVLAHKEDKPYIEGDKPFIKMNKEMMLKRIEALPTEQREQFLSHVEYTYYFKSGYNNRRWTSPSLLRRNYRYLYARPYTWTYQLVPSRQQNPHYRRCDGSRKWEAGWSKPACHPGFGSGIRIA